MHQSTKNDEPRNSIQAQHQVDAINTLEFPLKLARHCIIFLKNCYEMLKLTFVFKPLFNRLITSQTVWLEIFSVLTRKIIFIDSNNF